MSNSFSISLTFSVVETTLSSVVFSVVVGSSLGFGEQDANTPKVNKTTSKSEVIFKVLFISKTPFGFYFHIDYNTIYTTINQEKYHSIITNDYTVISPQVMQKYAE